MTINGGWLCPPPTPLKDDFKTLGESWKGGFPLSKKCHSEPPLRGVSNSIEGVGHHPLKTPPRKHKRRRFLAALEMTRLGCHPERSKGSPPLPPSLRAAFARSLQFNWGVRGSPSKLSRKNIKGGDVSLRST